MLKAVVTRWCIMMTIIYNALMNLQLRSAGVEMASPEEPCVSVGGERHVQENCRGVRNPLRRYVMWRQSLIDVDDSSSPCSIKLDCEWSKNSSGSASLLVRREYGDGYNRSTRTVTSDILVL